MAMHLSPEEIGRFLKIIGVSFENCKKLDKAAFLKRIITAFNHHIPFTNFNLLMTPKDQRCSPSWDTIKEKMMSRQGGLCYELNTFLCALLAGLGFHTYCGLSKVLGDKYPLHVIIFVKDLQKEGDTFVVDVGVGQPAFDAFPLDFEVESPCYKHNHVLCKYAKVGDHYVRRQLTTKTDLFFTHIEEAQWVDAYAFNLDAFSPDEIAVWLNEKVFLHSSGSSMHKIARAVICPPGLSCALKGTSDKVIFFEAKSGETAYRKRAVNSAAELRTIAEQYFTGFSWSDVEPIFRNKLKFAKSQL